MSIEDEVDDDILYIPGCVAFPMMVFAGLGLYVFCASESEGRTPSPQQPAQSVKVEKDPDYLPRPMQMIDAMFKREGPKPGNYCTKAELTDENHE
jgi:hypothetical protein